MYRMISMDFSISMREAAIRWHIIFWISALADCLPGTPQKKKILLDAYKQVASSGGNRYPDVNQAILDNFNKGILIFNYNGHGSENGIAEEQILLKQDIEKLNNKERNPLFIITT